MRKVLNRMSTLQVHEQEFYQTQRMSTGTVPRNRNYDLPLPESHNNFDIRREIDQSVRTAVEHAQVQLMNQLQASISNALTEGFQRLSIENTGRRSQNNCPPEHNARSIHNHQNEDSRIPNNDQKQSGNNNGGNRIESSSSRQNFSLVSQGNRKVRLEDWGFVFEGKMDGSEMTVDNFLFRVEIMRDASDYSNEDVFNFFSKITRGRAQSYYWQFRNTNRESNWEEFEIYFKCNLSLKKVT